MKKKKVLKIVLPVIAALLAVTIAAIGIFFNDIFWKSAFPKKA
ncbi:MAG: hypothetical protein ACI4N4_04365 [Candidatus Fimenecus sp.]